MRGSAHGSYQNSRQPERCRSNGSGEVLRAGVRTQSAARRGWITFLANAAAQGIELHTASQGGPGLDLPVISIGVSDLLAAETAVRSAGGKVVYGPVDEPWGLRRFFFRDPAGNLVNVVDS